MVIAKNIGSAFASVPVAIDQHRRIDFKPPRGIGGNIACLPQRIDPSRLFTKQQAAAFVCTCRSRLPAKLDEKARIDRNS